MSETISFIGIDDGLMKSGYTEETAKEMRDAFIAFCKKYNLDPNRAGNDFVRMCSNSKIKQVDYSEAR